MVECVSGVVDLRDEHAEHSHSVSEGLFHVNRVNEFEDFEELVVEFRDHVGVVVEGVLNEVAEEASGVKQLALWEGFEAVEVESEEVEQVVLDHGCCSFFEVQDELATDFHNLCGCTADLG